MSALRGNAPMNVRCDVGCAVRLGVPTRLRFGVAIGALRIYATAKVEGFEYAKELALARRAL